MFKNRIDRAGFIVTLLLLSACFPPAQANVYKCKDSYSRTYYQDKPCQNMTTSRLPDWMSNLSTQAEERAFLWKAAGDKGTLYLLGNLRYGTQSLYPLPQTIMDAFNASQVMIVQADLWNQSEKERSALVRDKGRYSDNKDLQDHVKSGTWNKTVDMGKKLGINEDTLRQYKPWLAALMLSAESLKLAGYTSELSLDQTFMKEALGKKPVMELESAEQQVSTLEGLADREQEQLLLQTLQDLAQGPDYYQNIADAWKKGDADAMDQLIQQNSDSGDTSMALFKVFYEERNDRIANRLKEMGDEDKIYFILLSAGQLGGDKGILKMLEAKGFKITQP